MAGHKEIACIVLSLNDSPGLVGAVLSLLRQEEQVEIIVVNSGGGRPNETLRAAGIDVRVISKDEPFFAGEARNIGIDASTAPYIAFLAADCIAEQGWISGRLLRHRAGALAVSSAVTNLYRNNSFAWASYILLFSQRMPGTASDVCLHYGVSYSRALFERFGRFRKDLRSGEDTEFNGRLSGMVPIQWAPDVRTAHRHPTSFCSLLGDQLQRGGRMALAIKTLNGKTLRTAVVRDAIEGPSVCIKRAWKALQPKDRVHVVTALPWILPASFAYSTGALLAPSPRKNPRDYKSMRCEARMSAFPRLRQPRIIALLAFHNEMRYLPGFFENVLPHVDGVIALDDGSTDGSGEFVRRQPGVIQILSNPHSEPHRWNEPGNQRKLIEAAFRHNADWLLAIDADERLEQNFRVRAVKEMERAAKEGHNAYSVRIRELWDMPDTYRADGIWGKKRTARFFKARPDHIFNERPLHGQWAPANSRESGEFPEANLIIYHLKMIEAEDRRMRQKRYMELDPDNLQQPIRYDYLTDERGLRCKRLSRGRGYSPLHDTLHGDLQSQEVTNERRWRRIWGAALELWHKTHGMREEEENEE